MIYKQKVYVTSIYGTLADPDYSPKVDIYYLHAPDPATPIEDTLAAIQELCAAGKFKRVRYNIPFARGHGEP